MKKTFSIIFAIFILASGMHFSIATHFCGGEVVSKKFSYNGSIASCGMESSVDEDCPNPDGFSANCCKNTIDTYSIDTNYENTAIFKVQEITKSFLQDFLVPVSIVFNTPHSTLFNSGASLPDLPMARSVDLAEICILRI